MQSLSEAFPSDYLKAADLKGQRVNLTIAHVAAEKAGNSNEERPVLHFAETEKKLGLNKTNGRMIAQLLGTEQFADWRGARITLRPDITNYPTPNTPCIRVDSELPPQNTGQAVQPPTQPFGRPLQTDLDPDKIPF